MRPLRGFTSPARVLRYGGDQDNAAKSAMPPVFQHHDGNHGLLTMDDEPTVLVARCFFCGQIALRYLDAYPPVFDWTGPCLQTKRAMAEDEK